MLVQTPQTYNPQEDNFAGSFFMLRPSGELNYSNYLVVQCSSKNNGFSHAPFFKIKKKKAIPLFQFILLAIKQWLTGVCTTFNKLHLISSKYFYSHESKNCSYKSVRAEVFLTVSVVHYLWQDILNGKCSPDPGLILGIKDQHQYVPTLGSSLTLFP